MKFIHLADLHLGKRVNEFSMLEDQQFILTQILGVIDSQRPDAVIIAGDVYDKPLPPAEAVRLFDDFRHQRQSRFPGTHRLRRAADGQKRHPPVPGV